MKVKSLGIVLFSLGVIIYATYRIMPVSHNEAADAHQRVVKHIEESVAKKQGGDYGNVLSTVDWMSEDDVPVLVGLALDGSQSSEFRETALAFLEAHPDIRIVAPFEDHLRGCYKTNAIPCDGSSNIYRAMASYYRRSHDVRALAIYIEMILDDKWPLRYKADAVRMLSLCQDATTINILRDMVLNNSLYPSHEHKAIAARAIAEYGDNSVLGSAVEYATILLDEDYEKWNAQLDRPGAMIEGISALSILARKSEAANQELLRLVGEFVGDATKQYIYREGKVYGFAERVLPAVGYVGREENIRFVEKAIYNSENKMIVISGIKTLGAVGDEGSVEFLTRLKTEQLECELAIARIRERLKAK